MRRVLILSFLLVLSTCKKEDDPTVVVNASVADSSMGSIDFKAGSYAVGAAVTFSATPQTGYTFANWTDSSTNQTYSNNPLTLNPDQNTTLVANFEKTAYNININVTGNGEVQKQVVGGGASFTHGATVELTAVPADQYSFFYWDNDPSDTTNPKSITLDGNKDVSAKFDYEVAKNLIGDWEFEIGGDSSSRNVTVIRMSVDIRLNVLITTIINGVMISQVFSQLVAISATSIVIGDFAVMTNLVVASATSLSMSMVTLPENTPAPTKESEIPNNATPLNLSGKKSEEAPQKDESGIIIPPIEATTSSSTTEEIGSVFADSINQIAETQSSTVASETGTTSNTGTTTSTTDCSDISGGSYLDLQNYTVGEFSTLVPHPTNTVSFTVESGQYFNIMYMSSSQSFTIQWDNEPDNIEELVLNTPNSNRDPNLRGTPTTLGTFNFTLTGNSDCPPRSGYSNSSSGTITVISATSTSSTTSTTGTTTSTTGTTTSTGGGGNTGTTSSTGSGGGNNSGTTTSTSSLIYFENGTCKCPNASVGDTATISGTLYTVVDNSTIAGQIANGNVNLCTTFVTNMGELFWGKTDFNSNISFWDTSNVTAMANMFQNATSFNQNIGNWDTSSVTNMAAIFYGATSFNQDISNWNISSIYSTMSMFYGATSFNQDISNWNTSGVDVMVAMFYGATSFNQDLSGWCVANITVAPDFANGSALTDANKPLWGKQFTTALTSGSKTQTVTATTAITPIQYTISPICSTSTSINASNLPSGVSAVLSNNVITVSGTPAETVTGTFNYSLTVSGSTTADSVTGTITVNPAPPKIYFENGTCKCPNASVGDTATISGTLYTVVDNSTITAQIANNNVNLCTTNVTDMSELFVQNDSFNSDIGFWDTSIVTNMRSIFFQASAFNQDIGNWDTSNVTDMSNMFTYAVNFNQDIGNWNTSRVNTMSGMFNSGTQFNQDIGNWDTSNVTNISYMFTNASNFNQNIGGWNTSSITNIESVFSGASVFNQNIGNWDVSNVINMLGAFYTASAFNQNIGNWNTSNVTNMKLMFSNATSFNQDIGNWNTSNVTNMDYLFRSTSVFNQNLSNWCLSNITSEPVSFASNSALSNSNKPLWGSCPSSFTINVTASNASDYTLSGTDRSGAVSGNDPTVTIKVGDTVNFAVNASGHPFYLKTVQGTGTANTISGVTNNGTTNGTVSWTPTQAGTYYYICSLHGGMVGTITVQQ